VIRPKETPIQHRLGSVVNLFRISVLQYTSYQHHIWRAGQVKVSKGKSRQTIDLNIFADFLSRQ
jgi:hypothetical protein